MSKKQQGLGLIEVMIASLILSFGLLGFMQGQLIALRTSEHAYYINLADLKNNELVERIRSCDSESTCIQEQLKLWKVGLHETFPESQVSLTRNGRDYASKISWFSIYLRKLQSLYLTFWL
ncbi:MAG: prepilin-type N-terminal cleavage/methylation domain-containing protein [Rickettsiella sp.]|nr:prepilin-type N-terminal cleavage/methylation domain-containing protein [Rickettsiella sp.]